MGASTMIVLWVLCMAALAGYAFIIFRTDFSGKEGIGVIKWLVICSLLVTIGTMIWMGVKIWFKN